MNRPTPAYRSSARSPGRGATSPRTVDRNVAAAPGCTCQKPRADTENSWSSPLVPPPASVQDAVTRSRTSGTSGAGSATARGSPTVGATASTASLPVHAPLGDPEGVDTGGRDTAVVDGHDVVGTVPAQACSALGVDGELDPGAPVEAARRRPGPARPRRRPRSAPAATSARGRRRPSAHAGAAGRRAGGRSPPQRPGPDHGQGGATRSGDAVTTSTASARTKRSPAPVSVTCARTRSPGTVCRTKSTWPSCRAMQ